MLTNPKLRALERAKKTSSPFPAYIRWEKGAAVDVACKRCGDPLTRGGRRLPHFQEVRLQFDDGSSHDTMLCTKCSAGLDAKDLEALYCDDMKALAIEEETVGEVMRWDMWADRIPTSYRNL